MSKWNRMAAVAIFVHFAALIVHSIAHMQLDIFLGPLGNTFILLVIFIAPALAGVLINSGTLRSGYWLLLGAMLGSFIFGLYNHHLVVTPDHVSQIPPGAWGNVFKNSAFAMGTADLFGSIVSVLALFALRKFNIAASKPIAV